MKLLIISHTPHHSLEDDVVGWGPTIREIDHLSTLFTHIEHLAPLHPGHAPPSSLPYTQTNITFTPLMPAGGDRIWDKLGVLLSIPSWLRTIRKSMRNADAVHIRCPAGISLVALLTARRWCRGKPCWVKYAGNWQPGRKEPWSYWLQRWLLKNNWHRGVVTINGSWPGQPNHIYTFNNPSLTEDEYAQAVKRCKQKKLTFPIQLLFVGRLDRDKGVEQLLLIANQLKQNGMDFQLILVGDSPQREVFENFVSRTHLTERVRFTGWKSLHALSNYYQNAHLMVFPSTSSEGWPKVLSEAMAHGVIPIASMVSSIPQTLAEAGVGRAIPPNEIGNYVNAIQFYIENPSIWEVERDRCIQAGVRYTYPAYLHAVQRLFEEAWQI